MKFLIPFEILWVCLLSSNFVIAESSLSSTYPISDPAVPMIQLPGKFRSHRVNSDQRIPASGVVNITKLSGPGAVRHIWFLAGDDTRLVIHVDDASKPQVDVPLKSFFGVMHGLDPYVIDCAAYAVLPNPLPNMPVHRAIIFTSPFHLRSRVVSLCVDPKVSAPLQWSIGTPSKTRIN